MTVILLKFWKEIALVLLVLSLGGVLYKHVRDIGYKDAYVKYDQIIKEQNELILTRISSLELASTAIAEEYEKSRIATSEEYKKILAATKSKPLVIYRDGVCNISDDFSSSYINAINRANKK